MILGLTGLAGSGKSTVCDYLVSEKVKKINFKDALVQEVKDRMPNLLDEIARVNDLDKGIDLFSIKPYPPMVRELLQNYGTEVRRRDDAEYWVKQWKLAVIGAVADGYDVVVDDCRFVNEAEAIRELGGSIIRIQRTDITYTGEHQSEVEMAQIEPDVTVTVDRGEQARLCGMVDEWIKEYGK